jgi:hypothetical protein
VVTVVPMRITIQSAIDLRENPCSARESVRCLLNA